MHLHSWESRVTISELIALANGVLWSLWGARHSIVLVPYMYLFLTMPQVGNECTERMFTYWLCVFVRVKCFVWLIQTVCCKVSLSCPARLILAEAPREHQEIKCPLKSPLCCVFMCYALYSSCMITTRLPHTFLLSLARGMTNFYGEFKASSC